MAMTFFTISNPRPKTPARSPILTKPTYAFDFDKVTGRKVLVQTGETNIFEEIQMFKDECNIYNIIRRYELGDTGILHKVNSQYVDTLGQPKTLQEALNLSLKLKNNFNSLKPEVRQAFGNDFNQFIKNVADGTVVDILKGFDKPAAENIVKENTDE